MNIPRIALTPGEPAGIGPDLCVLLAQKSHYAELVAVCDPDLLRQSSERLGLPLSISEFEQNSSDQAQSQLAGSIKVQTVNLAQAAEPGQLNPENSPYVLECLAVAASGCLQGRFSALATGPVHKGIINQKGISFTGHTEYLAQQTGAARPVMMLQTDGLRVALATTHMPLKQVAQAITQESLQQVIEIIQRDLQVYMGIAQPVIHVCGLNPHAGEQGHLGYEEIEVIIPVLEKLRRKGFQLVGPVPADTAFVSTKLKDLDVVLTMYHDQGLPVLKHMGFGDAVNVTLGLPIIRTSVDHGTALELAGKGNIDVSSFEKAVNLAIQMSHYENS